MRGIDHQQADMFSYLSPEQRVRKDHPLRAVRAMTDEILGSMSALFDALYAECGRPSIPPEKSTAARIRHTGRRTTPTSNPESRPSWHAQHAVDDLSAPAAPATDS